ncbi:MAG: BLUF domain-containing protein [Gemmatimonadaceae bacterium]
MPQLIHLIYASGATRDMSANDLADILSRSHVNNAGVNVSGILLYSVGSFFQVLEGNSADVDATFDRIAGDSRHAHTTVIIREPIPARSFQEWTMGYAQISDADADAIVGRNDFYAARSCLMSLNPGRARKLLQAFASGRWQSQVRASAIEPAMQQTVGK